MAINRKVASYRILFIFLSVFFIGIGLAKLQQGITLFSTYSIGVGLLCISFAFDPSKLHQTDSVDLSNLKYLKICKILSQITSYLALTCLIGGGIYVYFVQ